MDNQKISEKHLPCYIADCVCGEIQAFVLDSVHWSDSGKGQFPVV